MKTMGSGKRGGPMAGIANMLGLGGGGAMPTPEQMAEMAKKMPGGAGGLPSNTPGLPTSMPGLPPKFPGSGPLLPGLGAKPGLGGFPGLGKKK
jgi:signal recognition particle subunit SRP54